MVGVDIRRQTDDDVTRSHGVSIASSPPGQERLGLVVIWDKGLHRFLPFLALLIFLAGCAGDASPGMDDPAITTESSAAEFDDEDSDLEDAFGFDEEEEEDDNDPLEVPNRLVFALNEMLDVVLLQPAAAGYRFLFPDGFRDSVQNFMRNLRSPVTFVNDVFQGKEERAGTTLARFAINTTVGLGGLFDVADDMGYPFHKSDFGQTLGTYGVGEGFYLVLPILGPSSARDGVGLVADHFMDPLTYLASRNVRLARFAIEGIDTRSRNIETVEELRRDSVDFYARVRSLYRQTRENEINHGRLDDDPDSSSRTGDDVQSSSLDRLE